jgi:arylsulfatase A-like enzyme
MKQPNVVIIKSDQHNARCLGVAGHPQVRTPHLDRLAGEGVNFTRAFVQSPICSPSRMSYITGQYVHNHNVYWNCGDASRRFSGELPSLFSLFKANGYRTGVVGHIHLRSEWLVPYCDMYRDLHCQNNAYDAYLAAKGLLHLRDDEVYKEYGPTYDACASELSFEDSYEGYCFRSFCECLDERRPGQPFLFQIDSLHPHENYIPVEEFWQMYDGMELELPPNADEDLSGKPPHQQRILDEQRTNYDWIFEPKTYEAGRLRKLQGYFGCISQVDHMVGLVRQKLDEIGEAEDTIIVYCADHGDFALEHGFLEKAPGISYDAVTRTPFIWHWPRGDFTSGTVDELVESVDVFPTLCALCAFAPPDSVDGRDISGMLFGRTAPVRDFVITEFPLSRVIRTKEWKLCHRPRGMFEEKEDAGELYHVAEDPWEMKNLYDDTRYADIREGLRRTLFDWTLMTTRYGSPWLWHDQPSADGRLTLDQLRALLDEGKVRML